jgi:hypothetical protein
VHYQAGDTSASTIVTARLRSPALEAISIFSSDTDEFDVRRLSLRREQPDIES